jgi:glycosyltransferase involved in cell wall biosynthesis
MASKIDRAGLTGRVFLPGSLPDKQLHTLMAACDLFCLPSIERTEAFGIVLLEAMAFAKPLITTDIAGSGVNWVNLAEKTGLVVRASDSAALAEGIKYLIDNEQARAKMGEAAHERLNDLFDIKKVAGRILDLYSTLQTPPIFGL